jgi:hypothetical protein
MSKEEAKELPVALPTPEVTLSPVNEKIQALVRETVDQPELSGFMGMSSAFQQGGGATPRFEAKLRELLREGGNVNDARALHIAVANRKNEHIGTLLACGKRSL